MNRTPSPSLLRKCRWAWGLLGHVSFWLALATGLLLLFAKVALVPHVIRPLIDRTIAQTSDHLEKISGEDVIISYADLELSFGFNGLYVAIIQPHFQVGTQNIQATKVELAIYLVGLPAINIDGAKLQVTQQEDGSVQLSNLRWATLDVDDTTALGLHNIPVDIIAEDMELAFTTAGGEHFEVTGLQVGVHPNIDSELLEISFTTENQQQLNFAGHIDLDPFTKRADGYLLLDNAHLLVPGFSGLDITSDHTQLEVWAHYDGKLLSGQARIQARDLTVPLQLPGVTDDITSSKQATLGSVALAVTLVQPVTPDLTTPLILAWDIAIDNAVFDPGEPFLGTALTLTTTQASGQLRKNADGWATSSEEVRLAGPPGRGSFAFHISQAGTAPPVVDVTGSLPVVDYPSLANLLPLALSERGVTFLRDDLQVTRAQATTLVLQGSDFNTFPWPSNVGGKFLLNMDFFGATLDYATGYPQLAGADGSFALEGSALAVTVVGATVGQAEISVAHAGIDDLAASLSTLHVAVQSHLPEGALAGLLHTLPDIQAAAAEQLSDINLAGAQALDLAVTVPLDADDPVAVRGTLEAGADNVLTYIPLQLTLSELTGSFDFNNAGVQGIGYGNLLGSNIRVSLAIADNQPHLRLDGTFDLGAVVATLGLANAPALHGRSAIAVEVKDRNIELRTNLVGTAVNLPPPFGKEAPTQRQLTVSFTQQHFTVDYANGLARAIVALDGRMAMSLNQDNFPELKPGPGSHISGTLPEFDLDNLLGDGHELPLALPIKLDLQMPGARLLGITQPQLGLQATLAATVTVASLSGPAIGGGITVSEAGKLDISLSHVHFPEEERIDPEAQTIFVAPATLSPNLPPLKLVVDELRLGKQTYRNLMAAGTPVAGDWILHDFTAEVGSGSHIQATGTTRTKGEPHTEITLAMAISDLGEFLGNYTQGESILGGTATVTGTLAWNGSLVELHYPSMQGTLNLNAASFVLNKDSGSVKLINLLSPFTILQNLSNLPEDGFNFEQAVGQAHFKEGLLHIDAFSLVGPDININITGNTNLITERNNINSIVKLNNSKSVATAAITAINPALGAFLLFADKVLKTPLIGPVEIDYTITGTWSEPLVLHKGESKKAEQKTPSAIDN